MMEKTGHYLQTKRRTPIRVPLWWTQERQKQDISESQ